MQPNATSTTPDPDRGSPPAARPRAAGVVREDGGVIETLHPEPALGRPDLLAPTVLEALARWKGAVPVGEIAVVEIDPAVADTAEFCARYDVPPEESANCVVVAGRRGSETRMAACVVLATTRADVNGLVRRKLAARKASFAPVDAAVAETGMEYGGITPIGLPGGWPVLIDAAVIATPHVIIGSGVRRSKLLLPGAALAEVPGAEVLPALAGHPLGQPAPLD
jgi:prolyl-tRNA editing enzyme YbaK/EbsC (Cys-tRNA(Pro) deacylase)